MLSSEPYWLLGFYRALSARGAELRGVTDVDHPRVHSHGGAPDCPYYTRVLGVLVYQLNNVAAPVRLYCKVGGALYSQKNKPGTVYYCLVNIAEV